MSMEWDAEDGLGVSPVPSRAAQLVALSGLRTCVLNSVK